MSALELVMATGVSDSTNPKAQAVSCPGGKKALGGGGSIVSSNPNLAIKVSQPTGVPPTGWDVVGVETDNVTSNWSVQAFVICATVP